MQMIAFFQSLRGKLIFTYTIVTVLALLALEVTILFIVFVVSQGVKTNIQAYLSDVVSILPTQARYYLQPDSHDLAGLQSWLQETYDNGYASLPSDGPFDSPAAPIFKTDPMYVIAPDGTILAAAPLSAKDPAGGKYSLPSNVIHSKDILDHALKLDFQPSQISTITPDGNYLMAVPVQQNLRQGPLLAVIILTVKAPPAEISTWESLTLGIVPGTGLILLLSVAPFGALFGFIMSRSLTHRLKSLSLAADAWSKGDFSVQPQDRSQDEISYLGLRMRRMAEHIQLLMQNQHELGLLKERNRLARELHDTVKQETFATLMQVRAARNLLDRDPASARKHLDAADELIKTTQQELELIISELRPIALADQGLADTLNSYLTTWSQHSRISSNIRVQNQQHLPLEIEQTLFRITQEALSNVARHSQASEVDVNLVFESNQVTLCIIDNGTGFDPSIDTGFGLQSMRDRMAVIQGDLVVETTPGNGTTIRASAPTHQQEQK